MKSKLVVAAALIIPFFLTACGPTKQDKCTKLRNEASQKFNGKEGRKNAEILKDWNELQCTNADVIK